MVRQEGSEQGQVRRGLPCDRAGPGQARYEGVVSKKKGASPPMGLKARKWLE
jgi:hypothetical protein